MAIAQPLHPQISTAAGTPSARPSAAPLGESPRLRRLNGAQAAWANAVARAAMPVPCPGGGSATLQHIDAARWPETSHWAALQIRLAGQTMALRLAPHRQWQELAEPALRHLAPELQLAIAAHLTHELREALGTAAFAARLISSPASPLLESLAEADEAAAPVGMSSIVLALQLQPAAGGDTGAAMQAWLQAQAPLPQPAVDVAAASGAGSTARRKRGLNPRLPLHAVLARSHIALHSATHELRPGSVVLLDRFTGPAQAPQALLMLFDQPLAWIELDALMPANAAAAAAPLKQPMTATLKRWLDAEEQQALEAAPQRDLQPKTGTTAMTTHASPDHNNDAPRPPGFAEASVPVQALIELQPARIGEIEQWSPGTVLGGLTPVDGTQVLLRVAGQTVGRGRLVAIEALLGFELLEVYP
jgi:flagellar motor switch/type III secretory pathway protein FliN